MDFKAIASFGAPVLLIDTCSILDVVRDPTRDTVRISDYQAGLDLLVEAESNRLTAVVADQVTIEFGEHDQSIQDEAERALKRVRDQIEKISHLSAIFGSPGSVNLAHLDGHVARARGVVGRWLSVFISYKPPTDVLAKAIARMNANLAPARRGKESSKDCIVFETYLDVAARLRAEGLMAPIVLLSSNTKEYQDDSKVLKAEIAIDLAPLSVDYASTMGMAKNRLGL